LRTLLLQNVGGVVNQLPAVTLVREEARDRDLLVELHAAAEALRAIGKIPRVSS
jgi:hypothetical protein